MAQREAEIRDQMKALKAELRELQVAKAALEPGAAPGLAASSISTTIKDLARDVLVGADKGMTSGEILAAIKEKHGRDIDRTSLSPQLSRLKDAGELVLMGEKWFTKAAFEKWEQGAMEEVARQVQADLQVGLKDLME